jgi:hypothetical protein
MRIPARFASIVFSALLSAIMVAVITTFVLLTNQGWSNEFPAIWLRSCVVNWLVAFPTVAVVAPFVRRVVAHLTASAPVTIRERSLQSR